MLKRFNIAAIALALLALAPARAQSGGLPQEPADSPVPGMRVVCEDNVCRLVPDDAPDGDAPATGLFPGFSVSARTMGGLSAPLFVRWLEKASVHDGDAAPSAPPRRALALLLGAFVAGILLNLSPCVLPMIPVTLAVLGAGAAAGRRRGALLGAAYGLGITAAYGALGLACMVSGRAVGTLQSSPWFSLAAAVLLAAFALSLLGVLPMIDFTRFRNHAPAGGARQGGGLAAAFGAGVGFALLAGACVAPVMLGTLVAAVSLQDEGNALGFALPFVLGAGCGAPWVLLGAGIARLPRPGAWMRWVERLFGLLLLALAAHYAVLATQGFRNVAADDVPDSATPAVSDIPWRTDLASAVAEARLTGQPLFVYAWATWCRVCGEMSRTTFRDPAVAEALAGFVPVKVQCEDPNDPAVTQLFDELGAGRIRGLPMLAVLTSATEKDKP